MTSTDRARLVVLTNGHGIFGAWEMGQSLAALARVVLQLSSDVDKLLGVRVPPDDLHRIRPVYDAAKAWARATEALDAFKIPPGVDITREEPVRLARLRSAEATALGLLYQRVREAEGGGEGGR